MHARKEVWNQLGLCFKPHCRDMERFRLWLIILLLAQSNAQWSWAGGIKICPCQIFAVNICWIIGLLSCSCCYKHLRKQRLFKRKCQKKEPAPLNCNSDKYVCPSPQLLQQSVELLINLRPVLAHWEHGRIHARGQRKIRAHIPAKMPTEGCAAL